MSGQGTPRVRRIASPSTKQGPIKATQPFGLVQGSPTKSNNGRKTSPSTSPTQQWSTPEAHRSKARRSPDNRASPDRTSPSSPGLKVERPKAVRSPVTCIKRTGSLDAIAGLYQSGQWPRDPREIPSYSQVQATPVLSVDKCTQTPDDWEDSLERKRKALHKRSASLGNGDTRKEVKHWSKKTDLNRVNSGHRSPVHGGHLSLLTTLPPSSGPSHLASKTVGIPVSSKRSVIRIRGSVEGPSTEIERALNISGTDELQLRTSEALPDGHRAPVTELLASGVRSVDTQTPSGYIDETRTRGEQQSPLSEGEEPVISSSGSSGASHSGSPSCPIIVGQMDSSRPSSVSDSSLNGKESDKENECDGDHSERLPEKDLSSLSSEDHKCVPSPKPNKSFSFVREPPDGCEKVKMVEEMRSAPPLKEPLMSSPVQKPGPFRIPSQGSAFNPPFKHVLCPPPPVVAPLTVAAHLDN